MIIITSDNEVFASDIPYGTFFSFEIEEGETIIKKNKKHYSNGIETVQKMRHFHLV